MFTLKVEGFKELEAALRKLPEEVAGKVLRRALRNSGLPMRDDMRAKAKRSDDPGPQGHMADSIDIRNVRQVESDNDIEIQFALGPDAAHWYGIFPEFGTVHQAPSPFMRPAFDEHAESLIQAFGEELGTEIEKAARKLAK